MFYVKIHKKNENRIVSICDKDLLGKTFEEGNRILEVNDFYKGELIDKEEVKKYLCEDTLNLVGKNIISLALELEIINKESIVIIKGIPHAQVF